MAEITPLPPSRARSEPLAQRDDAGQHGGGPKDLAAAIIDGMGKFVRGGYILVGWKADHEARPIHVQTDGGRTLGRLNLATLRGREGWTPSRQLAKVVLQLKKERNL